jgi:hypothetical protein
MNFSKFRVNPRVLFLTCLLMLYASASHATRMALVIGNDAYRTLGPLKTAQADASAMAKALETVGFKVKLHLNVDDRGFKSAVRAFKAQLAPGDEAVFFYAGHGVQIGTENYLVPINTAADDTEQIKDESVPLRRVLEDMQDMKPRFSLAIIDACRNNPFMGSQRSQLRASGPRGLIPAQAATGQMVIYSAGAGQSAIDQMGVGDADPNGVFTRVLLREIATPGVPVDRMVRRVRDQVVALARSVNHEQVPAIYDQTIGDFYFVSASLTVSASALDTDVEAPTNSAKPAKLPRSKATSTPASIATTDDHAYERGAASEAPQTPKQDTTLAKSKASLQPLLAALQKEQTSLTIKSALDLLLEPNTSEDQARIDKFHSRLRRLSYKSAFALGPVTKGNLRWGLVWGVNNARFSKDAALENCALGLADSKDGDPKTGCSVVFANGRLDSAAWVESVRNSGVELTSLRAAWQRRLVKMDLSRELPAK